MRINKILFWFGVAGFVSGAIAGGLTEIQKSYLRERVRVVRVDTATIPGYAISHMRRGAEEWAETNKLAVINFQKLPRRISKLKLIVNLKAAGKWDAVKSFIQSNDLWDEWNAAQYITEDYPAFKAACDAAVAAGLGTAGDIEKILDESQDTEGR